MVFSKEEAEDIKKQLLIQVESLPNENKDQIKKYIEGLNEEQLEEFLKKNNIQMNEKESADKEKSSSPPKCIFCSIINNEVPSYKIDENKKSIAILEINPLSRGHSIVLPLKHIPTEKIPKNAMSLSQKIANRIKKKFKPEDIKIETSNLMGHAMINIIPIYKEPLKKIKLEDNELKLLQDKLEVKLRKKRKTQEKEKEIEYIPNKEDISKLPKIKDFRIP
ncbi:MAG: HIT domain-containing protein [Candidatus Pacearchaeota archaeon]|jgi:histidine triad (HIT) family protein